MNVLPNPRIAPQALHAVGILLLAGLLTTPVEGQGLITSITTDARVTIESPMTNAIVTIVGSPVVTGPWAPDKNAFVTGVPVTVDLEDDRTRFYRALFVDLTPSHNGFFNLVASYSLLTTIAGLGSNTADEFNSWDASFEGATATSVELSRPHIAMADRAGNVYIADKWGHSIRKVRPDGVLVTVAGNNVQGDAPNTDSVATEVSLNQPNGLYVRADGTVYILDLGNGKIRRLSPDGTLRTLFTVPGGIPVGRGLYVSDDEDIAYVCAGTVVKKWTAQSGVTDFSFGYLELGNLTLDHNGELVVTDRSDRRIESGHYVYRLAADGSKTVIAGNGTTFGGGDGQAALQTGLNEVRAVAFLPTGAYFLGTHRGSQIWYVDTDGIIHLFINGSNNDPHSGDGTYFYAPSELRISEVRAITIDYQGNLLICEHDAGYIRKVQFLRFVD